MMISVVILAKNEEKNIKRCLESVRWCDEIIVIDDNSSDKTVEVANKFKATICSHTLDNDFSAQRNFGLSKAKNEWVLFLDSDEALSDVLAYEMSSAVGLKGQNQKIFDGFYIKRIDCMWGKKLEYGETGNMKLMRLARKSAGEWSGVVHEEWKIRGNIETLNNLIIHYPHQTITEFLKEINYYTTLRVKELYSKKVKTNILSIILYPSGKFILNYIIKRGFLDGIPGLVHALLMSFHSFLVRGNLWLMWNKK